MFCCCVCPFTLQHTYTLTTAHIMTRKRHILSSIVLYVVYCCLCMAWGINARQLDYFDVDASEISLSLPYPPSENATDPTERRSPCLHLATSHWNVALIQAFGHGGPNPRLYIWLLKINPPQPLTYTYYLLNHDYEDFVHLPRLTSGGTCYIYTLSYASSALLYS